MAEMSGGHGYPLGCQVGGVAVVVPVAGLRVPEQVGRLDEAQHLFEHARDLLGQPQGAEYGRTLHLLGELRHTRGGDAGSRRRAAQLDDGPRRRPPGHGRDHADPGRCPAPDRPRR